MSEDPADSKRPLPTSAAASFSMACRLEEVRPAASQAKEFLLRHGVTQSEAEECELALVEACNNAVLYATAEQQSKPIEIQIICNADRLEFSISDHTAGFQWPDSIDL